MRLTGARDIPPVLDRYEAKYTIPEAMIGPVSDFVSVYCSLDRHSEQSPDAFYGINNLYLDSPAFHFLRKRLEGSDNRFNMRIRSYGGRPEPPFFLEVKQKKSGVVRKFRARINQAQWEALAETGGVPDTDSETPAESGNKALFHRLALSYQAAPKVLTQYRRKAYISDVNEYARVTFDRDLRYHPESEYNITPDERKMSHYDASPLFDPECGIILELKCYCDRVPLWMIDLVRYFSLKQRSFSKYAGGAMEVLHLYSHDNAGAVPVSMSD